MAGFYSERRDEVGFGSSDHGTPWFSSLFQAPVYCLHYGVAWACVAPPLRDLDFRELQRDGRWAKD